MQEKLTELTKEKIKKVLAPIIIGVIAFFLLLIILFIGFFAMLNSSNDTAYPTIAGTPSEIAIAEVPADLLPIFTEAGEKYNVSWAILAAICNIESSFGTYPLGSVSSAGAVGIMQFMPTTWSGNSNIYLPRDDKDWRPSGEENISTFYDSTKDTNLPYDIDPQRIATAGGYGVDADGDGFADPYNPYDAIYSTAYMLSKNIEILEEQNEEAKMNAVLVHYSGGSRNYATKVIAQAKLYSFFEMPRDIPIWPVDLKYTTITSPFGYRIHPITKAYKMHNAIDIAGNGINGSNLYAVFDGIVKEYTYSDGEGYGIIYSNKDDNTYIYCCHLQANSYATAPGRPVYKGQVIAKVGNTGTYTKGPHLHIEVVFRGNHIDPLPFLQRGYNMQIKGDEEEPNLDDGSATGNY